MRKIVVSAVAVAALAGVLAVPALAGSAGVKIGDNWFVSKGSHSATVRAGTTVTWTWTGKAPHNVVVTSGPQKFSSGSAKTHGSYSRKVSKKGTYRIVCQIHPGMAMTLKVV